MDFALVAREPPVVAATERNVTNGGKFVPAVITA